MSGGLVADASSAFALAIVPAMSVESVPLATSSIAATSCCIRGTLTSPPGSSRIASSWAAV